MKLISILNFYINSSIKAYNLIYSKIKKDTSIIYNSKELYLNKQFSVILVMEQLKKTVKILRKLEEPNNDFSFKYRKKNYLFHDLNEYENFSDDSDDKI